MAEELQLATKEFQKMQSLHTKLGFQEGVAEGHKSSLQKGFDQGFQNGARCLLKWGHLIGEINALRTHSSKEGLTDIVKELDKLLEEVKKLKDSKTKQVEYTEENTQNITSDINTLLREPTEDLDLVKLQAKFDEVLGQIEI